MTLMQKLVQFATHHWALVGGFLFLLVILFIEEARAKGMGSAVSIHEAINLMNHEGALIIDARAADVFRQGHIAKARNMPADQVDIKSLKAFKEKPVIVVCERGQASLSVAAKLRKAEFKRVQVLKGGMQSWSGASMPTKKGK